MATCIEFCVDADAAYPCEEEFRGPAIIFHDNRSETEAKKLSKNLSSINFKCSLELRDAGPSDNDLRNVACNWQLFNSMCIFLAFLLPEEKHLNMEKAVMKHFNNTNCKGMFAKPKIFLFVDTKKEEKEHAPQTLTNSTSSRDCLQGKQKITTTTFADIIIVRAYSAGFLDQIYVALKSTLSRNIISVLRYAIRNSISSYKIAYFDSTLRQRLDLSQEKKQLKNCVSASVFKYHIQEYTTNFVSRDSEITEIEHELQEFDFHKMDVLIFGPSGVGKTEVMLNISARNILKFNNIILFDCSNQQTLQKGITEIASHLNVKTDCQSIDMMQQIYIKLQSQEKTLIIFDNLENSTDWFRYFLPQNRDRDVKIVGISTHNDFKFLVRLKLQIRELSDLESVMFMSKMLKDTDMSKETIEKITGLVGSLPMNLEIAGNFIRTEFKEGPENGEIILQNFLRNYERIITTETSNKGSSLHIVVKTLIENMENSPRKAALHYLLTELAFTEEMKEYNISEFCKCSTDLFSKGATFKALMYLANYSIVKVQTPHFTLHNLVHLQIRALSFYLLVKSLTTGVSKALKNKKYDNIFSYLHNGIPHEKWQKINKVAFKVNWNDFVKDVDVLVEQIVAKHGDDLDRITEQDEEGNFKSTFNGNFAPALKSILESGMGENIVSEIFSFINKSTGEDRNNSLQYSREMLTSSQFLQNTKTFLEKYDPEVQSVPIKRLEDAFLDVSDVLDTFTRNEPEDEEELD